MRATILSLMLAIIPSIWAAQLSPTMEQPGDFVVIDSNGRIQFVGRFEADLTVFFRAYAEGRSERGRAPFVIGLFREGKIVDSSKGVLEYSISEERIVFTFSPGVQDAGLSFLIHFDPSTEVSLGEATEGNIAGPKPVGTAHVRFKKKEA